MDWKPWEVKQSSIADLLACQRGWLMARGVKSDEMNEAEAMKLRMEAFGD